MGMVSSIKKDFKAVEVLSKGERKTKEGKLRPWFKGQVRDGDFVDCITFSGDGVEVGKKYDISCYVRAFNSGLFFNMENAVEVGSTGVAAKKF